MHTSTKNQAKGDVVLTDTTLAKFDNHASILTQNIKRWMQLLSGGLVFGLSLSMLGVTPAMAGSFSFTKIADNQSEFTSISTGAAINDHGTVAFVATLKDPSQKPCTQVLCIQALYTSDGVSNTEIINTKPPVSSPGNGPSTHYSFTSTPSINNNGTVAIVEAEFTASLYPDQIRRLLLAQGGSLTIRGSSLTNSQNGSYIEGFVLNQQDEVAYFTITSFRGGPSSSTLVFDRANQPSVKTTSSFSPLVDAPFSYISSFDINNQGELIFAASPKQSLDTPAIFSSKGGEPTSIVETGASALNVNDKGNILLPSRYAIRLFDRSTSTLRTIFDTSSGSFQAFGTSAINNNDNVAFTATLNGGERGIFTGADPVADKVIATGDSMFGSTVTDLNFLGRNGLNNNGQIAFYVKLANGEQAIYRAEPVAETPIEQPDPQVEDVVK